MPISDKNRKVLWARSGNRCAFCRVTLVIEKTAKDAASVVGEECHIVSSAPTGPRFDSKFSPDSIDDVENLVLLCATHHKMIDDQFETYTAVIVRSIKQGHEKWVEEKLQDEAKPLPVRIRRFKENIPKSLARVTSGKDLLAMISGTFAHYPDHDSDLSDEEVELVGGFMQEVSDWRDIGKDLEPIERVRTAKRLHDLIQELESREFYVFAASEAQRLEGGVSAPSNWPVLHLSVLRASNPNIHRVDESEAPKA